MVTALGLLSNGALHSAVAGDGSGSVRWRSIAVSRWREDAALGSGGTRLYLRDDASGELVSLAAPALSRDDGAADAGSGHGAGALVFRGALLGLEATLAIAIDADRDVELRRLVLVNRTNVARICSAAAMTEIVLAPAAADSAHQAFNKLFVETHRSEAGAVIATRRPSKPEDVRCWAFHRPSCSDGGSVSFETDRARFIGRGGSVNAPQALLAGAALSGTVGPVLDAVLASRVAMRIDAGASCTIDWFTGIAETSDACDSLIAATSAGGYAERLFDGAGRWRQALLERIGASASEADVFERLAGALLVADARLRAPAAEAAANRLGQSGLWRFGISGDVPIVFVEGAAAEQSGFVRQLVRAQAFWKAHGLASELMVACPAAVVEPLTSSIHDSVGAESIDHAGGVFVRDVATLSDDERTLLRSAARIVVAGDETRLDGWLASRDAAPSVPASSPRVAMSTRGAHGAPPAPLGEVAKPAPAELVGFNGHGGYTPDLREYVIVARGDAPTPAPWCNVLANPEFGTLITESGSASSWSGNAHEFRLTPWSNDPVGDPNSEAIYLEDEGSRRVWSPTLQPAAGEGDYVTRHGFGCSRFEHEEDGIASVLEVFVAIDLPVKFSVLTLANRSGRARRLSVTGIVEWVLGDERAKNLLHIVTERDDASGAVLARNGYNIDYPGRTAFFALSEADAPACGDRVDFFGAGGTRARPAALEQPALSGRLGAALDPCAALRSTFTLAAGESTTRLLLLGAGATRDDACSLVARCLDAGAARTALAAVRTHWQRTLGTIEVTTGDPAVDAMANGWLLYQAIASRLWGRTAFYQSSGAYGFRDQLQDVMSLVHCAPGLVREHLLRAAARQFPEGDVQHWWHPPSGKGIRTRCSDDYLWLPFVVARYVETSADVAVLDQAVPFLDAPLLKESEVSSYSEPKVSSLSAPLYEHCVRAIRHGLSFGVHGLPLMGGGDWNDGMDLVGAQGRGESVWLAFFLVAVLKRFAPLARDHGDTAFADTCEHQAAALSERIEASAWDGGWYLRAWFDDGTPLGSAANRECQIDSIAQSWSVLSGAAPTARARQAMDAVHERLVRPDMRLIELLHPPFDTATPSPGYIAGYVPGVRENGGQYTHGVIWSALAFAALGDAERAWAAFELLNPTTHGNSAERIATYKVEPYVIAGDVYSTPMHAGRGGWTWYSGSAGWMSQLLIEALLGFDRRGDRLRMRPLLPRGHAGFTMRYRHGETGYVIDARPAGSAADAGVLLDGTVVDDGAVMLRDDGVPHAVTVRVWRPAPANPPPPNR